MTDKQKQIMQYLKDSWAPLELLVEKFNINRSELSRTFAEMLAEVDVRVENDIVHVS
jgi:hypothetical protein